MRKLDGERGFISMCVIYCILRYDMIGMVELDISSTENQSGESTTIHHLSLHIP